MQVGQAYLFNPDAGALLRTFNDPEPANNVQFGQSVAMINHYAIIGAGHRGVRLRREHRHLSGEDR